jgi:8-oxo-(d)GTP phosphatase
VRLVRAAGGIVMRAGPGGPEVVLVHRPAYDDWSFPKGKLEPGEDESAAALREVEEETGLRAEPVEDLGAVTYVDGRGRPKVVRYWRMEVPEGAEPSAANEVDLARWVPLDEAEDLLTYPHDRQLLRRVVGQSTGSTSVPTYVVRHVKAGDRQAFQEPDELRGITKRGRRQAKRLAEFFEGRLLGRLFSSPYLRCTQTFEPLAEARGLEIELAPELAEGAPAAAAEALVLAAASDGPAAFCTHGDVQQSLIENLLERGVRLAGDAIGFAKGSIWVLEVRDGLIVAASYVPPPPDDK